MMVKLFFRNIITLIITLEARLVLKKYKPKIIGITGNAGKTSVKDAVAAVLGSDYSVWKNEKSYNSDLGIPLTILHCKNAWLNPLLWMKNIIEGIVLILFPHKYPEWLVLEIGADKPNDIGKFTHWLKPDIIIVTRIGQTPVHVENFASREQLIKEKGHLVSALKSGGILILNADDADVLAMKELPRSAKVLTYGFSHGSNLRASNYNIIYGDMDGISVPDGITFKIDYLGNIVPARILGVVGRQNVYSALAAFAAGVSLNINFITMIDSIAKYERPVARLKLIRGMRNSTILDDTYNSSPAALGMAIESSRDIKVSGKKIAVLGDMLELGKYTSDAHYDIGKIVPASFDLLITVGLRSHDMVRGAEDAGMERKNILSFNSSSDAGDYLNGVIASGDLILVKGSQGMRMEKVVERIMADPKDKTKLLARQETEWQKKV